MAARPMALVGGTAARGKPFSKDGSTVKTRLVGSKVACPPLCAREEPMTSVLGRSSLSTAALVRFEVVGKRLLSPDPQPPDRPMPVA
ncbi:hypothetical protein GCM10018987_18900 [Streptomyces cremeus]